MYPIWRVSRLIESPSKADKELLLCYFLAPVITGIKPSTILHLKKDGNGLFEYWQENKNFFLKQYHLSCKLISIKEDSCQILFYDIHNLASHLQMEKNECFLAKWGYRPCVFPDCLEQLQKRMKEAFPHESGIFFGIPLEDVQAYMENKNCILQGYWKVYHQKKRAEKIFHYYDASKHLILSCSSNELLPKAKNTYLMKKTELYA